MASLQDVRFQTITLSASTYEAEDDLEALAAFASVVMRHQRAMTFVSNVPAVITGVQGSKLSREVAASGTIKCKGKGNVDFWSLCFLHSRR